MNVEPPTHLAKHVTELVNKFLPDEKVYRRCINKNSRPDYPAVLFLEITWEDVLAGLSVNRSSISNREDVLWSPRETEIGEKIECTYEYKEGTIFEASCSSFPTVEDEKTKVSFILQHTPINCNYSHCDISVQNLPYLKPAKPIRNAIKAFLSTFFK